MLGLPTGLVLLTGKEGEADHGLTFMA